MLKDYFETIGVEINLKATPFPNLAALKLEVLRQDVSSKVCGRTSFVWTQCPDNGVIAHGRDSRDRHCQILLRNGNQFGMRMSSNLGYLLFHGWPDAERYRIWS